MWPTVDRGTKINAEQKVTVTPHTLIYGILGGDIPFNAKALVNTKECIGKNTLISLDKKESHSRSNTHQYKNGWDDLSVPSK